MIDSCTSKAKTGRIRARIFAYVFIKLQTKILETANRFQAKTSFKIKTGKIEI